MSKISDELREFIDEGDLYPRYIAELRRIADRIDAEMVELPRDANDEPILPGDTVWGCISGMQMAVHELELTDRWAISTDTGFIPKASAVTHVRPDSFEHIADELEEWSEDNRVNGDSEVFDRASIFADRIRKLADSFERIADELEAKTSSCGHQGYIVVSRDEVIQIADRIRKLAKRED